MLFRTVTYKGIMIIHCGYTLIINFSAPFKFIYYNSMHNIRHGIIMIITLIMVSQLHKASVKVVVGVDMVKAREDLDVDKVSWGESAHACWAKMAFCALQKIILMSYKKDGHNMKKVYYAPICSVLCRIM